MKRGVRRYALTIAAVLSLSVAGFAAARSVPSHEHGKPSTVPPGHRGHDHGHDRGHDHGGSGGGKGGSGGGKGGSGGGKGGSGGGKGDNGHGHGPRR
jgi:hypothetical protein